MTQIHTNTLSHTLTSQLPRAVADRNTRSSFSSFVPGMSFPSALICPSAQNVSQSVAQVKGILFHSALVEVETKVEKSVSPGLAFPAGSLCPVLLSHTGRYSQPALKQMTPGFPTIDHNKKNTPTASCSHLPLQRHHLFLSLPPSPGPLFLLLCASPLILIHAHTPASFCN